MYLEEFKKNTWLAIMTEENRPQVVIFEMDFEEKGEGVPLIMEKIDEDEFDNFIESASGEIDDEKYAHFKMHYNPVT